MAAAQPPLKLNVNGLSAPRAAAPVALWPTLAHVIHKYKYYLILAQTGMWVSQEWSREDTDNSQIHNVRRLLHNLRHHVTPELIIAELYCYWKASTKVSPWELFRCSPCSTKVQQPFPLVLQSGLIGEGENSFELHVTHAAQSPVFLYTCLSFIVNFENNYATTYSHWIGMGGLP